jgi:hypothetical protein
MEDRKNKHKKDSKFSDRSKDIKKDKKDSNKSKLEGVVNFDNDTSDSEEEIRKYQNQSRYEEVKINYYKEKQKRFTISVVIPSSIVDNA